MFYFQAANSLSTELSLQHFLNNIYINYFIVLSHSNSTLCCVLHCNYLSFVFSCIPQNIICKCFHFHLTEYDRELRFCVGGWIPYCLLWDFRVGTAFTTSTLVRRWPMLPPSKLQRRRLICFPTSQTQNNYTETILIVKLLGQWLWRISSKLLHLKVTNFY